MNKTAFSSGNAVYIGTRMKNKDKFLMGGVLLSATALFMRISGLFFNIYVTGKIGSSGMGLITLINSVYSFAITFAVSGIKLTATRLCAEALEKKNGKAIRSAIAKCFIYAVSFGTVGAVLLFSFSRPISISILHDERTLLCLRILAFSLPFISLSAVMSGYFAAVRRVGKSAAATILEQLVRVTLSIRLLGLLLPKGITYSCIAIVSGTLAGEVFGFLCSFILYLKDKRRYIGKSGDVPEGQTRELFSIALPVAFTAYVRSGLLTLEHILIPIGLKSFGLDSTSALSEYGIVQAMALPVVLFPIAVLSSFTQLLVPEVSGAVAVGDMRKVKRITVKVISGTLLFSLASAFLIYSFSLDLGMTLYSSRSAAKFIKYFSILIPVMYFDTAVDSLLGGLGEQVWSMKVNIIDAALSVILVWLVLPKTGITGYVGIIFVCEILNALLSVIRLIKRVHPDFHFFTSVAIPSFCALGAVSIVRLMTAFIPALQTFSPLALTLKLSSGALFFCIFYSILTNNIKNSISLGEFIPDNIKHNFKKRTEGERKMTEEKAKARTNTVSKKAKKRC